MGILLLPMIKITRENIQDADPFHEPEYEKMNYFKYSAKYMYYGLGCIFGYLKPSMFKNEDEFNTYTNDGECRYSFWYILGYIFSQFVIQYNLNSIMHHNFVRWTRIAFAFMVPVTILAFLLASVLLIE